MSSKKIADIFKDQRLTHIDRNLDRNIFLSSQTKYKSYVFEVPIVLDDSTEGKRYIVIGKTNPYKGQKDRSTFNPAQINPNDGVGVLKTSHLKAIAALIANWEDKGKPNEKTTFSVYSLLTHYYDYKQTLGRTDYEYFKDVLLELRNIPITFIDSFEAVDGAGGKERVTYTMNVLSDLKIYEKFQKDGQLTISLSSYKLDGRTLRNLLGGYSRPILLRPLIKKKGDAAILLYRFANTALADRERLEITTRDLFDQLEMKEKSYDRAGKRKEKLERAIKENEGEPIVGGTLHFRFVETRDHKDYQLIITKRSVKPRAGDSEQPIHQDLLPNEVSDISPDKRPFYLFLKEHRVSFADKVIKRAPHSAEVMELIVEDFKEKLHSGFVFRESPQAWLVGAFKNPNYQPKRLTKSRQAEEQKKTATKNQIWAKERELVELKETRERYGAFLALDGPGQLTELFRERRGVFYVGHKRWPNNPEDRQALEQECKEQLPQIIKERRGRVGKVGEKIKQLMSETAELNRHLSKKE